MTQTHAEPHIDQVIPAKAWTVTPEMLASYRAGLEVTGSGVPQMLANAAETTLLFSQPRGHLWLRQEWEFHKPLREGTEYSVEGRVIDIYPRRDRTILLTETHIREGDGSVVSVQRHHQSFLLENPPAGEVQLRKASEKEGASRSAPVVTRELGSIERSVSLEMCGEFFYGSRNYHSDRAASKELGFQDVVVGGRMTMGYVGEILDAALGEQWATTGRLLVKFTNVLWPGEQIRVSAGIAAGGDPGPGRESIVARVEKADGTVVIVAEGSVASQT